MNNLIKRVWTRKELVFVEDLRGMAFTNEDGAHTFSIAGKDENGTDLALSGTVAGSLIRPDGTTTAMTGTIADGCANLTLSPECYGVSGRASLTIFLTSGGQKTAIYHAVMSIGKSSTSQVSPGVAADVVDLVNRIDTATASIPATYTALLGSIASDYSSSKTYKAGNYVWYGGYLYKANQDIDTAESWTSGHWTKAVLADDFRSEITDLKSALQDTNSVITNNDTPLITKSGFEKGSITNGNNDTYRAQSRARNVSIEHTDVDVILRADEGWNAIVAYYESDGTYTNTSDWSSKLLIKSGSYFRLLLGKNNSTETIALDTILSHFSMTNCFSIAVDDIKKVGIAFDDNEHLFSELDFIKAGFDSSGEHSAYRGSYRASTVGYHKFPFDVTITALSGFMFQIARYQENGTFVSGDASWQTSEVVPGNTKFRVMIATRPETTSGDAIPLITLVSGIKVKSNYRSDIIDEAIAITSISDPQKKVFQSARYEHGTINSSGGNDDSWRYKYRARTKEKISFEYAINISAMDGFMFIVAKYQADGTFISIDNSWKLEEIIPADTYIRIMIATRPETTSGDAIPVATLVNGIRYASQYAKALEDVDRDYNENNIVLPAYYDNYIKEKASSLRELGAQNGISFAFITDVHVENNAGKSPALIKYLAGHTNSLPFVVFGGDVVMDRATIGEVKSQAAKWIKWVNAMKTPYVFQCIGNHDYHGLVSEDGSLVNYGLNQNLVYNFVMGRQLFHVNAVYGKKYYYFDIHPANTRVIVLDCYDTNSNKPDMMGYTGISTEQLQWLADTAFANMDGYHVICISHEPFDTQIGGSSTFATIFSLIKAFANKTTFESGTVSADFTQDTNEFVMLLSGHTHADNSNTSDGILSVVTTCDSRYTGVSIDSNRVIGTVNEQAFDVFSINYTNKEINATRIGYGSNRVFDYDPTSETFGLVT